VHGHVADGALVSDHPEPFRLRPAAGFEYRGAFDLAIEDAVLATRHHFVEGGDEAPARLVVVQFEHFVSSDGSYVFALPDPVELAGALYGRWAFELRVDEERARYPGKEMDATVQHLERLGIAVPNRHPVARFARAVGLERRHEVIVFVHECRSGAPVEGVLERALGAFSLE
jgi:hypothetical protein